MGYEEYVIRCLVKVYVLIYFFGYISAPVVLKEQFFLNYDCLLNAAAYKQADGRKLDNKRVLVVFEQGRTVPK